MNPRGKKYHHAVKRGSVTGDIDAAIRSGWRNSYMIQTEDVAQYVEDPSRIKGTGLRPSLESLLDVMQECNARSVLDVGCNAGYAYDWLRESYATPFEYIGVDINAEMIDAAKALHDYHPKFMQEDLFELDLRADVVFCSRVLIHLPDFSLAMRALYDAALKAAVVTLKIGPKDSCETYALVHSATKAETGDVWFLRTVSVETLDALDIPYVLHPQGGKYATVVMKRGDV